ncbi:hypothetical protein VNO78_23281 [Psophocarpus tetragonolobus]|uniref:Uncharacterized protein n=1 Tax=Psophocarpus tetragonolobus TaxID=3891 RepID=A0AAN9S320_PSOTE
MTAMEVLLVERKWSLGKGLRLREEEKSSQDPFGRKHVVQTLNLKPMRQEQERGIWGDTGHFYGFASLTTNSGGDQSIVMMRLYRMLKISVPK